MWEGRQVRWRDHLGEKTAGPRRSCEGVSDSDKGLGGRSIVTRDWGLSDSAKGSGGRETVSEPVVCAGDGSKANLKGGIRFGKQFGPPGAERGL